MIWTIPVSALCLLYISKLIEGQGVKRRASKGEGRERAGRMNQLWLLAATGGVIKSLHMQSAAEPLYDKFFKPTRIS